MNIRFSYLYRDAANYKNYHEEIFANAFGLTKEKIEGALRSKLIDGLWFYVHEWGLEDLHVHQWDNELDHTWHELESIEETTNAPTKGDIIILLNKVAQL